VTEEKLPKENKSQKIGRQAKLAFQPKHPESWIPREIDGDDDFGYDYMVQISDGEIKSQFFVQLKGSKQVNSKGEPEKLNNDKTYYSQELKVATLNKYRNDGCPVMLVFADLTQSENPRDCNCYYTWVNEDINNILDGRQHQDSITINIPVSNVLHDKLNIIPDLEEFKSKNKAFLGLWHVISKQKEEPLKQVDLITQRFSNGVYLDSILQKPETPWPNPPKNTLEHVLCEVSEHVKSYKIIPAEELISGIADKIDNATDHVKAEYYYQLGNICKLKGEGVQSIEHYRRAFNICSDMKRYKLAYLENKLNNNYKNIEICKDILSKIENETEIEYTRLKAKTLAFLGNENAIDLLETFPEKQVIIIKSVCYLILKKYEMCQTVVKDAIDNLSLDLSQKFRLFIFLVRSLFSLGFKEEISGEREFIVFAGTPDMDDKILKECWEYTLKAWDLARQLNYPPDLSYIIDVSGILGMYFMQIDEIYSDFKNYADKYKNYKDVQETLLGVALQKSDFTTTTEQFERVEERSEIIIYKILMEYDRRNMEKIVELATQHLDRICSEQPRNLDIALLVSAECAERLAREEDKRIFLKQIKNLPNCDSILACYEFFENLNRSQLNLEVGIQKLYQQYKKGSCDPQLLYQFMHHLNPYKKEDALKIIEICKTIEVKRKIVKEELFILAEALATLEEWQKLFNLSEQSIIRFGNDPKFLAIKAMALDKLGNTPEALKILQQLLSLHSKDAFILELSANIYARCGFADKAIDLLSNLLATTKDRKGKIHILRMLYMLEMHIDFSSGKLVNYCKRYGEICDHEDIEEEGIYLQLVFGLDVCKLLEGENEFIEDFYTRRNAYIKKFPESTYLRAIHVPTDASPEEQLAFMERAIGLDEDKKAQYAKYEAQIKSGQMIVPFLIRHHYLLNICDLLHLWQLSKSNITGYSQYHLAIEHGIYKPRKPDDIFTKTPLIDEITLVVLNDLGLLNDLFKVFTKIAITKSTIARFQNWGQHFISIFSSVAQSVTETLKKNITQIIQPTGILGNPGDISITDLKGYRELIKNNESYVFYSDDAPTRMVVYDENYFTMGMTTVDLIEILRTHGTISDVLTVQMYSKLCSWSVQGVPIKYIDILRSIKHEVSNRDSLGDIVSKLNENEVYQSLIGYIWNFEKTYKDCLLDIASFVVIMIAQKEVIVNNDNIICGIWYDWYLKVSIKHTGEVHKLLYASRSFLEASIRLANRLPEDEYTISSSRLWSIYKSLVKKIYEENMDEQLEKDLIKAMAILTSELPDNLKEKTHKYIFSGIEIRNPDARIYTEEYVRSSVKKKLKK